MFVFKKLVNIIQDSSLEHSENMEFNTPSKLRIIVICLYVTFDVYSTSSTQLNDFQGFN